MELKLKIEYAELLDLIKQLPINQISKLLADLNSELERKEIERRDESPSDHTEFQELLLNGPVMSDEEYQDFQDNRKHFNAWRTN